MKCRNKSVVLMSGGVDSSVMLHQLVDQEARARALYLNFGKPMSAREIHAVKVQSLDLEVPLDVIDVRGIADIQRDFAPILDSARDELDVKDYEPVDRGPGYVSGFPIVLSVGTYYAQLVGADEIHVGVIGNQVKRHKAMPDAMATSVHVANGFNPSLPPVSVRTPFALLDKSEVIRLGNALEVRFAHTWSCLLALEAHCGRCSQCLSRKEAFRLAGVADPTTYLD